MGKTTTKEQKAKDKKISKKHNNHRKPILRLWEKQQRRT